MYFWCEKRAGRTVVCLESFARKGDLKELWLRATIRYIETQKLIIPWRKNVLKIYFLRIPISNPDFTDTILVNSLVCLLMHGVATEMDSASERITDQRPYSELSLVIYLSIK